MQSEPLLVADVGGTNARFGIATRNGADLQIQHQQKLPCERFSSFESVLSSYYETLNGTRVRHACIAAAGPITGDRMSFTNLDWTVSTSDICRRFELDEIRLINDFAAIAHAIPQLDRDDVSVMCDGEPVPDAPIAVIGPGTGLGVAALLPGNGHWDVLPSEGGHALLAPSSELEARVIGQIGRNSGVNAETLLSGRGICRIYNALCRIENQPVELRSPESISSAAAAGTDPLAVSTINLFCRFLATKSRDTVLTFGARGGLYLAGGILPAIEPLLRDSEFTACFRRNDGLSQYLEPLKVTLVRSGHAGLIGAASWSGGDNRRNNG